MSGTAVHVCRACAEEITDPADAVAVAHELGNSGPGWTVWAHVDDVDDVDDVNDVELIDQDLLRIMTRIWATRTL